MKKLYAGFALLYTTVVIFLTPLALHAQTTNNIEQKSPAISFKNRTKKIKQAIIKKKNTKQDTSITGKGCPVTTLVLDADGDGYYTGDKAEYNKCNPYPGPGWTEFIGQLPGDCNDNDPLINPAAKWVLDADKDGYYTGNSITQCSSPGAGWAVLTNQQPNDCDDNDASATLSSTSWVLDNDKDGYYTGDLFIQCHSPGKGYVRYSNQHFGDCNDNDAFVHQVVTWVIDNDNDGYYTDAVTQCSSPGAEWIVQTNQQAGDCDDNDASVHQINTWVLDNDLDGYYTGNPVIQCSSPGARWVVQTNQQPGDCDDNNPEVNPANVWVLDADEDGYYSGDPIMQCNYPGGGWVLLQNSHEQPGDCNDYDASVHTITWVLDADGDGYYAGDPITQCDSPGDGYVKYSNQQAGDCDDNDPSTNAQTLWVYDADGDGYYSSSITTCAMWDRNWYKWNANFKPGDCNDNDASIHTITWVLDADGDGYYAGDPVTQCTSPDNGYVMQTNQQPGDCNDNDPSVTIGVKWVLDADNDGYYTGDPVVQCTSPGNGFIKLGDKKELSGDCDDNNPAIHPGAVEICGNGIDDNCDGQIDEGCIVTTSYHLTTTSTGHGTIGTKITFAADAGYHIADIQIDGSSQGAITSYTFSNVTADHGVNAIFAINTFMITATAATNGTLSPVGSTIVNYGGSLTYTITPKTGYHIIQVTVDGSPVGAVDSYTFSNVIRNHTIKATFAINTYTIVSSAEDNGTITPNGSVNINYGGSKKYTIKNNTGYHILDVLVDGVSVGAVKTYTFTAINANHTISASFASNTTVNNMVATKQLDETALSLSSKPNPFKNNLTVMFTVAKKGKYDLTVTDMSGRVLIKQKLDALAGSNMTDLNVACYAQGSYFITLTGDSKTKTIKVIKTQ